MLGLEIGGDDYVTKPFSPRELVARVGIILRRGAPRLEAAPDPVLAHGGLTLDPRRHEARFGGEAMTLTAIEFAILAALAARPRSRAQPRPADGCGLFRSRPRLGSDHRQPHPQHPREARGRWLPRWRRDGARHRLPARPLRDAAVRADKWRPSLGLVVLGVLAIVAMLPLFGLFLIRVYENGPIREAEAELIAQSAVLAAVTARAIEALPEPERFLGAAARPPGGARALSTDPAEPRPRDRRHPRPPPGRDRPGEPARFRPPGARHRLLPVLERTQAVTLAGFRITDRDGTVIAGRNEVGRSLADLPEVAAALKGAFRSVLRQRVSDEPAPALTSISRGTRVRLFTAMPIRVGERVAGVVYASRTPSTIVRHLYGERVKLGLAAAAVLAAVLAIAALFSRAITRPIHALVARSHAIARGNRAVLAEPGPLGTREIALLSRGLDRMAHQLHERSDYIATFAAHVSHELKTPLTAIQGAAELMRDAQASPPTP